MRYRTRATARISTAGLRGWISEHLEFKDQEERKRNHGFLGGKRIMSTIAPTQPTIRQADSSWIPSSLYRLTLDQYEAMVDSGVFSGRVSPITAIRFFEFGHLIV